MEKKVFKRISSACLALLLLFSLNASAFAMSSESPIMPLYAVISYCVSDLEITKTVLGGKATCTGEAVVTDSNYDVTVKCELQKLDGTWKTLKSWSESGNFGVDAGGSYYVSSGYTYRVKTTVKVYNSNGSLRETATEYSNQVHY